MNPSGRRPGAGRGTASSGYTERIRANYARRQAELNGTRESGQQPEGINVPISTNNNNNSASSSPTTQLNINGRGYGRGRGDILSTKIEAPGIERYNLRQLKSPVDLFVYSASKPEETYVVTGALSLNVFHIVPNSTRLVSMLKLSDVIALHADKLDFLTHIPAIGNILLARRDSSSLYKRVEVMDVVLFGPNAKQTTVKEVDTGRFFNIKWTEAKMVNDIIMDQPIIGYDVTLDDVEDSIPKILLSDFEGFVKRIRRAHKEYRVVERSPSTVNLISVETKGSLGLEIKALAKWNWELILTTRHCVTDADMKAAGDWESHPVSFYSSPGPIPWNEFFIAEMAENFSLVPTEGLGGHTVYIKPKISCWNRLEETMYAQITDYMRLVKGTPYFPAAYESAFIRSLAGTSAVDAGRWHRMIRFDVTMDGYYDIDRSKFLQIASSDDNYEYRMVPPDFCRIPMLTMEAVIFGLSYETPETRSLILNLFRPGNQLHFQILKEDQRLAEKQSDIVVVRCFELFEKGLIVLPQAN